MQDNFIRTSGTQGVIMQEYNGKYSMSSAWEGKDGKINMTWAKLQTGRDEFAAKATPVKVGLGEKDVAIGVLRTLLSELEG